MTYVVPEEFVDLCENGHRLPFVAAQTEVGNLVWSNFIASTAGRDGFGYGTFCLLKRTLWSGRIREGMEERRPVSRVRNLREVKASHRTSSF